MRLGKFALGALVAMLACSGSELGFPWDFERMIRQPRYEAFGTSKFFPDGRAMRSPPLGAIPFEPSRTRIESQGPSTPAPNQALLERGRERFDIFCAACHGANGKSETPVARIMSLRPPPSLHEARVRRLDLVAIHRTIEQGYGLMPSYAGMLPGQDSWAVAYYVKALQLSQEGTALDALPPALRERALRTLGNEAGNAP